MQHISFTVTGNPKNPSGNPMGYKRVLNHSWRSDASDYMAWLELVKASYYRQTKKVPVLLPDQPFKKNKLPTPIILEKGQTARLDIKIFWRDNTHADCDNVVKGIADALFVNDKKITAGSWDSELSPDKQGRVVVDIFIHGH